MSLALELGGKCITTLLSLTTSMSVARPPSCVVATAPTTKVASIAGPATGITSEATLEATGGSLRSLIFASTLENEMMEAGPQAGGAWVRTAVLQERR